MIGLVEYVDTRGKSPFRDWILHLDTLSSSRISSAVLRMGNGNFSQSKAVGEGVSDLRMDFGPGFRVYFGKDGEQLVILQGGGK